MERRLKLQPPGYLFLCLITALFLGLGIGKENLVYAEENRSIEQVYVNLPEVTVYGNGTADGISEAYLGSQKLNLDSTEQFGQTGEAVYYCILLDVSNSIPTSYFEGIKASIGSFEQTLRAQDRMLLYTFGEEVSMQLGEEHTPEQTQAVLASLKNTDNRTLLFEAINQASDMLDRIPDEVCKRRVMIVISDGEDFTIGKTGAQEAQNILAQRGIPVYAFGIADTARENTNSFGEFARTSGGNLTVFEVSEAGQILNNFARQTESANVWKFSAETNIVPNSMQSFMMTGADGQKLTRDVMVSRYIPDRTAPVILRAELVSDQQLEVEFSEPVDGSDQASAYTLKIEEEKKEKKEEKKEDSDQDDESQKEEDKEDEEQEEQETQVADVTITGVTISTDALNTVILALSEKPKSGNYQLVCTNITDRSMEKNLVSAPASFEVEKGSFKERTFQAIREWYWIGLILLAVVLVVILLVVYYKVKKKHGVIYVDGKPVLASNVELHKHIKIEEAQSKSFELVVRAKGSAPETLKLTMQDSFIIGRSKICNLYLDDKQLSRQHFALEWDGTHMFITDLDTTNGTFVNHKKITKRNPLRVGDEISAGSLSFVIRW
ncbi:FHA domain-containing protein [Brotaphodocola sp.]|uniref:FHA domain-containing protein n=1 Tax=Brotaphodocola sp. TaxID=3073577 RepID=UPI003D7E4E3D